LGKLEIAYPKQFKEKIAPYIKRNNFLEQDCINLNTEPPKPEELFTPTHLFPTAVRSQTTLRALATDIPKDVIRAKESWTNLP
jgi:hypothetical protein